MEKDYTDGNLIQNVTNAYVKNYPCRTLLFVGAGASKAFGMPTMKEFFNEFFEGKLDLYKKLKSGDFSANAVEEEFIAELIYFMIKDKEAMAEIREGGKPSIDLEYLMTDSLARQKALETLDGESKPEYLKALTFLLAHQTGFKANERIGNFDIPGGDLIKKYGLKLRLAVKSLSSELYKIYDKYIEESIKNDISNYYHPIFSLLDSFNDPNIAVFTTNYDRCLDVYLDKHKQDLERKIENGFLLDLETPYYSLRNFDLSSSGPRLSYFNLHGSVAWTPDARGKIFYEKSSNLKADISTELIPLGFPVVSKGPNKHPICGHMYRFLELYLNSEFLTKAVVIGFSFRDDEINNIFNNALERDNFKLIIMNPSFDKETFSESYWDRIIDIPEYFGAPKAFTLLSRELNRFD